MLLSAIANSVNYGILEYLRVSTVSVRTNLSVQQTVSTEDAPNIDVIVKSTE